MRGTVPEKDTYTGVFISDIHMRNDWPYSRASGERNRTDRFQSQMSLWDHVNETARLRNAEGIHVLGDLFDRPLVDPVTMAGTVEALTRASSHAPMYVQPGNHDEHKVGSFQTEVLGELGTKRIQILGHAEPQDVRSWLTFWPFHYRKKGIEDDFAAALSRPAAEKSQQVALIHQSVKGCSHLGWVCDDGVDPKLLKRFSYTLAGHFHDHQFFIPKRGMYLGSPMHHHFGDVGRSAQYWVIRFKKGAAWKCEAITPGLPTFHTMQWEDEYDGAAKKGDYLRIEVHKTSAEFDAISEEVLEVTDGFKSNGINVHVKFRPIYHHGARLASPSGGPSKVITIDDMIGPYIEHPTVSTDCLDEERLASLGRKYLGEARRD